MVLAALLALPLVPAAAQAQAPGNAPPTCRTPAVIPVPAGDQRMFTPVYECSDPDGDRLRAVLTDAPAHGRLGVGPVPEIDVTYTADAGYRGPDAATFRIEDGRGGATEVTFTFDVKPFQCAAIHELRVRAGEDNELTLGCSGAGPGVTTTFGPGSTPPAGGTASAFRSEVGATAGGATYRPDRDATGIQRFELTATRDGVSVPVPVEVHLIAAGTNQAPNCVDYLTSSPVANTSYQRRSYSCFDEDGDPLTYAITTPPAHGSAALGNDYNLLYFPAPGYVGPDAVVVRASDDHGGSTDKLIRFEVVAGKPVVKAPPAPPPPAMTPPAVGLAFPKAKAVKLRQALPGLTVPTTCAVRCDVAVRATVDTAAARKLGLGKRTTQVANGTARGTGRVAVRVRFTAQARRKLAAARSVPLRLTATASATGRATATARRTLTLRR